MNRAARRPIAAVWPPHHWRLPDTERCEMLRKILLGCGVASVAVYVGTDAVAALRYEGYYYTSQTISEPPPSTRQRGRCGCRWRRLRAVAANEATPWLGVTERIAVFGSMLWISALCAGLLRAGVAQGTDRLPRPAGRHPWVAVR